ncbi:hypothetical protein [Metabacillus litoralis]|nr:hypothetical protein [Metabacillus litoralis]
MKTIQTATRNQLFLILSYAMHFKDEETVQLILDEVKQRNFLGRL